ncbi:hypothetical protein RJ639_013404 [Escallonia herrerae]|uniref:Exonuclease domain-containing protein n=1 Tax=Escallonia herrerae TaxID=1293975 RepID=A0AA89AM19_9ASTE|nr:hypothetical protein RJ639_013404 [Escallonia herrerae]
MAISNSSNQGIPEIVFFDLETNVPSKAGQRFWILEFGAMAVCPRKLVEIENYCTLIRPGDLSAVPLRSGRCGGITREAVANCPMFEEVANRIFDILDGRIWAGHNIRRFDCVRLKEAFAEIGRPAPVPVGMIDSLGVLTEKFGRRAGNMKMATLAAYFGLGQQKHRIRPMSELEAEESSLPDRMNHQWQNSYSITTRSKSIEKLPCREETSRKSPPTSLGYRRAVPYARGSLVKTDNIMEKQMTKSVTNMLCKAQNRPLNSILKHSHSLLR